MKRTLLASASAAVLITFSGAVLAQDADSQPPEDEARSDEVVVSATRREERLQDVPLSISAYGQDELSEKGIVSYEGVAFETPGAVLNRPTQNFNNFSVRGVATNGYNANLQSTVAIYIDELPISANGNSTILDPSLFDVERVEFLRGPQGTLFGSGSLAGAMRIITKSPDLDEFDAAAAVDLGLTGDDSVRQRYNAMVNVPLAEDKLALRIVGFYRNEDGYLDNLGTGVHNSNALKDWGGRAVLLWEPIDWASVRLTVMHEDSKPEDSSLTSPSRGREVRLSDRPDLFQANLDSYNATIEFDLGFASLTSSSTYSEFDQSFVVDLAGTFGQLIPFALDAYAYDNIFVEEVRLVSEQGGRFDWVVGGFYYDKRRDVDYNYRSSPEFLSTYGITGLADEYYQRFGAHTNSLEAAGFGELTFHATENFWLTGGLRYGTTEVQSFTEAGGYNSNYLAVAFNFMPVMLNVTPIAAATGVKRSETGPSYKVSASFRPTPEITTYASVSTGFRTPIANARAGAVSIINPSDLIIPDGAESDKLRNYEVGLKGSWFDNKLTANLAVYLIDWKNIQVQANRLSDQVQFATNIGRAKSKGVEFEILAKPFEGLDIGLTGSVNDSKVTELTAEEAAISGAVEGIQLAFPHFQGSAYVKYSFDINADTRAFFAANVAHVGAYPSQFPNVPGNPNQMSATYGVTDDYRNVNMSLGAEFGDHLKATIYVENLFDDHSITYIHPEGFLDSRFGTLRPRTVGVRLGYDL